MLNIENRFMIYPLYPLKFIPAYKDYVWGGRNLERLGKSLPEGRIAESWEVSVHPDGISTIANGIFRGFSLKELIDVYSQYIIGSDIYKYHKNDLPLLFKLIDANDRLSVQVHPDDDHAQVFEMEVFGKHEAWYIINAKPDAKIVYGLVKGTDKESFSKAVNENRIDQLLNYIDVFPGDVIDVYPGVVHAICEGIILAEIQQNSNITYRIYDYNRLDGKGNKRETHIAKALEVIDFGTGYENAKATGIDVRIGTNSTKTYKLSNKHFTLEVLDIKGSSEENTGGNKFHIYFVVDGEAQIKYHKGKTEIKKGETVLIPASLGGYSIRGIFKALKVYVPDLQQDIILPLIKAGHSIDEINNNVCRYYT